MAAARKVSPAAIITRRADEPVEESVVPASDPIAPARRGRWILWSFVPSALMLGVTRYLATDVASVPLLWIVPLFLYLTTFIIAFGRESHRRTMLAGTVVRFGAIPLLLSFVLRDWNLAVQMGLHRGWFFFAALVGHSRLAEDRPPPDRLTEFYLWISIGGVAGGAFAALLAPVVFSSVLEYPIAVALGLALLGPARRIVVMPDRVSVGLVVLLLALAWLGRIQGEPLLAVLLTMVAVVHAAASLRRPGLLAGAVAFALLVVLVFNPSGLLAQERSFFGVYQVEMRAGGTMELRSGTTTHGTQRAVDGSRSLQATSYYHPAGPIGQVMASGATRRSVGIVGLGVGGLAAYGRPGDSYTFFEIDPAVVEIAENTEFFTYLSGTPAAVEVVVGDGRLALGDSDEQFDLLVIDAFNSDAIPIHLLTREAIETYAERLVEDGVLAIHVSNRHFALAPVVGRVGGALGLSGRVQFYRPTEAEANEGSLGSLWVVLARNPGTLSWADSRWEELLSEGPLWTDDYSDILRVWRF